MQNGFWRAIKYFAKVKFFPDEYISHFTIREGGMFCENVHLSKLDIHTVKKDAERLGIHSVYTNRNRRWDELNGWQKPDKDRWPGIVYLENENS